MDWYWWGLFLLIVAFLFAMDLGVFQRNAHRIELPEALGATAFRVALALAFNAGIYFGWIGNYASAQAARTAGIEFLTGYLVEVALSVDNVFVFAVVFRYFRVEAQYQHRVLIWGIFGALIMRASLIFAGIALVEKFHWVMYLFAAVLIYGGVKMMRDDKDEIAPEKNPIMNLFRRLLPITKDFHGQHFFVRSDGRFCATPLFLVLVMIETTDLLFALDSIPAVLAVTLDPFIVFTSNVFAILGLRAMYFALAGILPLFRFLHYGLSAILIFIGVKMMLSDTPFEISTPASLAVVGGLLLCSIAASLIFRKRQPENDQNKL